MVQAWCWEIIRQKKLERGSPGVVEATKALKKSREIYLETYWDIACDLTPGLREELEAKAAKKAAERAAAKEEES